MIQLYDRDAAVVAAVLRLVANLVRAHVDEFGEAAEALHHFAPADLADMDRATRREPVIARLNSIVAAIDEQRAD